METEEEKFLKMREDARVDAYIPLHVRYVPEEERPDLRSRTSAEILEQFPNLPEIEDSSLSECLRIINAKLDSILNMLTFQGSTQMVMKSEHVNISGSGLGFSTDEPYDMGDVLELKLMLPNVADAVFYVYGDVVKVDPQPENKRHVSVRFTVIDEDIRDVIVKFVFHKQREVLRKKRRQ